MKNYLNLITKILEEGEWRETRNSRTKSIFGVMMEWDLQLGFPILTTKQMKLKSIASELAWILEGSRDDNRLKELNGTTRTIWTDNADTYKGDFPGDVGQIYGPLLRGFHGVDQLYNIVDKLKNNPTDRRMLVSMWDPSAAKKQCLPTCHYAWQVYVRENTYLDLVWHQRSVDVGLGLPYDIVHYAMMIHLLARTTNYYPGKLKCTLGDTHIYESHTDMLQYQTTRDPMNLPTLYLDPSADIWHFEPRDVDLINYQSYSPIKLEFIV